MENMFAWYQAGSRVERRTFWACFSGWALDTFDLQVFNFILPSLMLTMQLTKANAGSIATVALLSSAVGGWAGGILSDRYGRVRMLIITILWFTGFGLIAGFTQSYQQLLVCRALQGIGFGGEWAIGAALMAEVIKPAHRGKALGLVQSGYSVGLALASISTMVIVMLLPPALAWRAAFWIGVVPGLLVLWISWTLPEPEIFTRMARRAKPEKVYVVSQIFRDGARRSTLLSTLLLCGVQSASYSLVSWMPTLLIQNRHMSSSEVITASVVVSVGAFVGFSACAYLSDRLGRRPCLVLFVLAGGCITALYTLLPSSHGVFIALGFLIGFFVNGMFAAIGPYLSEQFPTDMRASGMGFTYNVGKAVGATAVTLVGITASHLTLAYSIEVFCLAGFGLALIALLFMPETRGRRLDEPIVPEPVAATPLSGLSASPRH